MTLLTSVFAAVVSSVVWYCKTPENRMMTGILCLIYWGASLMWLTDAVFEYIKIGADYFRPAPLDMLYDFYLGLCAVALGLVIWLAVLFIKDPKGVIKQYLLKSENKED